MVRILTVGAVSVMLRDDISIINEQAVLIGTSSVVISNFRQQAQTFSLVDLLFVESKIYAQKVLCAVLSKESI